MRIFKYWAEYSKEIIVDDFSQPSKTFGGSNISIEDAKKDALNKLKKAQERINSNSRKDSDYEADIMEEIIEKIDDGNIVTRNRYGALVLNSKDLFFIDIDSYSKSIYDVIFNRKKTQKELMLAKIEKNIQNNQYSNFSFRLYETFKGYRLLISNQNIEPRSKDANRIMRDFNSDYLYRWLCVKQNCYRARLTPKPHRVNQKRLKMIFPNRNENQEITHQSWVNEYNNKSNRYATCNFILKSGPIYNHPAIEFHDKVTNCEMNYKLA